MQTNVTLTIDELVLERLDSIAKLEGVTTSRLIADILRQIADTDPGHIARVIGVTQSDVEEVRHMFVSSQNDEADFDLTQQRRWMGAMLSVELNFHREWRSNPK